MALDYSIVPGDGGGSWWVPQNPGLKARAMDRSWLCWPLSLTPAKSGQVLSEKKREGKRVENQSYRLKAC
jgi:hypothetical protein